MCKAPLVPKGTPVINSLFRQRTAIENILRACVGLPPNSHIALEQRVSYFSEISFLSIQKKNHSFKQREFFFIVLFLKMQTKKNSFNFQFDNLITRQNEQPPIKKLKKCQIAATNGNL